MTKKTSHTGAVDTGKTSDVVSRRLAIGGLAAFAITGWHSAASAAQKRNYNLRSSSDDDTRRVRRRKPAKPKKTTRTATGPRPPSIYGPMRNEKFPIPALGRGILPKKYWRTIVDDPTGEKPGTVVVDTPGHYLYLVLPNGKAMRYGVGVGKAGFEWQGRAKIAWKRKWPTWTPPASMIEREPHLEKYREGMEPGLKNPLGARALYIHENGVDTLYRVHGTNEPRSIGKSMSSGCIRMINQDVIDLYKRVRPPANIVVRQGSQPLV